MGVWMVAGINKYRDCVYNRNWNKHSSSVKR